MASAVTHCDRGNAVYDRELDSIFIDTSLFDTADFRTFLSNTAYGSVVSLSDLPFLRTYLRFLLLHEIGHRQLHGSRGSIFDSGRQTMAAEREREADDFAFDKLTGEDKSGGNDRSVDQSAADLFDLNLAELTPVDTVATDLAAMVVGMNLSFLFIPNPYAPYYADDAHQTFVARSRSLIHSALRRSSEVGRAKNLLQTVDQLLQREESATQNDTTEVIFPEPLADVTFDGSGIRATSVQFLKTYSVPLTVPGTGPPSRGNTFHSVWAGQGNASPMAVDDWWKVSLWTTSGGQTFAWRRDGTIFVLRKGKWEHQDAGPWSNAIESGENVVFLPAQPSASILVEAKISDNNYRYSVVQANGLVASRKESDIMEEIASRDGVRPKSLKPLLVTEESAFVAIEDVNQAVWGVAQLNMRSLAVLNLSAINLPPSSSAVDGGNALAVIPEPHPRYYLFSSAGAEGDSKSWAVWKVGDDRDPALLLQVPYFTEKGGAGAQAFGGKSLEAATWLGDDRLLVAIGNDSLYELDVTAKRATPVFHPGDEIVKKRIGRNGTIAVFVQGGFKCYVIRPQS